MRVYRFNYFKFQFFDWSNYNTKKFEHAISKEKYFFKSKHFLNNAILNYNKKIERYFIEPKNVKSDLIKINMQKKYNKRIGQVYYDLSLLIISYFIFNLDLYNVNDFWISIILFSLTLSLYFGLLYLESSTFKKIYSLFSWENKEILAFEKLQETSKSFLIRKSQFLKNRKILKYVRESGLGYSYFKEEV